VVPLLAVSFALFTRVPGLQHVGEAIRAHLLKGLLPPGISTTVLKYLGQFTANTSGLTVVGSLFLLATALSMLFSVERVLNRIWQVKKERPPLARLGLYLLMLAAAPAVLGASLFYFVPNTRVRRREAIAGGLLASIAFEFGKRAFAAYLFHVATYKTVYGAFAPLLVFLLWLYFSWLVTLAAAVVAANFPGRRQAPARLSRA
jgi:membrane protein